MMVGKLGNWEIGKLGNWEIGKLGDWEIGKLGNWEIGKIALVALCIVALITSVKAKEGDELIGKKAPELELSLWINSKALTLKELKGKVVLLRWWTGPDCPYCTASAPVLNEFHETFGKQGLVVIGIYHPKPRREQTTEEVKPLVKQKGFEFAVALDNDWAALKRYWLNKKRNWTSVSFLLDKKGIIRYIHPGGEYHKDGKGKHEQCQKDYTELKGWIEKLLKEKDA